MATPTSAIGTPGAKAGAGNLTARNILLGLAAIWFFIQALPLTIWGDPALGLIDLVQRLALGFALLSLGLIDWRRPTGLLGIQ